LQEDEILMSFDNVSLLPNIPIDLALHYIEEWLTTRSIDAPALNDTSIPLPIRCVSSSCHLKTKKIKIRRSKKLDQQMDET
jgi:hypothetical protein